MQRFFAIGYLAMFVAVCFGWEPEPAESGIAFLTIAIVYGLFRLEAK